MQGAGSTIPVLATTRPVSQSGSFVLLYFNFKPKRWEMRPSKSTRSDVESEYTIRSGEPNQFSVPALRVIRVTLSCWTIRQIVGHSTSQVIPPHFRPFHKSAVSYHIRTCEAAQFFVCNHAQQPNKANTLQQHRNYKLSSDNTNLPSSFCLLEDTQVATTHCALYNYNVICEYVNL